MSKSTPLRIANCSGFFGDRSSAAREMIDGGPIDVLTGDWLAELTMGVLAKQRVRNQGFGHAKTFIAQLDDVLGDCLDQGIKIVSNAGGLDPHRSAAEVTAIAGRLGRTVRVAVVDGDDATELFGRKRAGGWDASHLDSGEVLPAEADPIVVNAYLGGWGIAEALGAGADVVITGRVTDAAVVVGPAAWYFGWDRTDWDALAGAVAAGHVIECGAQATGGNFSFFNEISDMSEVGFPIAEIYPDGSSIITKHPGTGGGVTADTVTAQLLYEVDGPRYANPDVVTRLDSVRLESAGVDRVRLSGVRGEPAPANVKVGAVLSGGWRNETTFVLTGTSIEEKAQVAQDALWKRIPNGEKAFDTVTVRLLRADRSDPATMEDAVALLTITVTGADRRWVSHFSRAAVEIGLATYPGAYFTSPPQTGTEFYVFWPTVMRAELFNQRVTLGERTWTVSGASNTDESPQPLPPTPRGERTYSGPTRRLPLGTVLGARSGDKAGNATLGVWARNDASHAWLRSWWSEDTVRALLPEAAGCEMRLWELPRLRACGVTIIGLLGRGVAANPHLDSQAKGLGEYLRAKHMDMPTALLHQETS